MDVQMPFEKWGRRNKSIRHELRQTYAIGLLPLLIWLVLWMANWPRLPSPGATGLLGMTAGLLLCLWGAWNLEPGKWKHEQWCAHLHFATRYLLAGFSLLMLWWAIQSLGLVIPVWVDIFAIVLILVWPLARFLHEFYDHPDKPLPPRQNMFQYALFLFRIAIGVWFVTGCINTIILELNRDYPTDPTAILVFFRALAGIITLACFILTAGHWHTLFGRRKTDEIRFEEVENQDTPPDDSAGRPDAAPARRVSFGSDKY